MTDKQKNLVIRSITGVFFVVCMVSCFLNPRAMVILFALITGLSIWEYCGLAPCRLRYEAEPGRTGACGSLLRYESDADL